MRQKSKKWMAIALSLAMLIAMLPSAALAEAPQEADSSPSSRTTADPAQNEPPEIKPVIDGDKEVEVVIHGKPSALIVDLPGMGCFRAKPGGRAGEWVKDKGNSTSDATLEEVDDHTVRVILPKGKTFEEGQVITAYQAILVRTTYISSPHVTCTVAAKPTVIQPMPDANGNLAAIPDGYVRITFNPTAEGSLVGQKKGDPASFDVLLGTSWSAAKTAGVAVPGDPTHSNPNMQFKGWTNLPTDDGTVSENLTITANFVELSDQDVIPYIPADPANPINLDDTKVPTKDKDGKIVDKRLYDIVAFTVADADKAKGSLTLGDKTDQQAISALVKKGSTWDKVTAPTIKVANATTTKANGYDPAIPAGTEPVVDKSVYTAQFITNGQEITPGTKLPDGVYEVSVSRDETSIKDNILYGKSYAVFKDSKLSQEKFPTPEANDGYKNAKWYKDADTKATADPSAVAITANMTFIAKAVSSTFDKDKVTGMIVKTQPKLDYVEGSAGKGKLDLSNLVVTLTDKNGNKQDVPFDQLGGYGITATPANGTAMTLANHNGNPVTLTKGKLTAKTDNLTVTKENSKELVIPFEPPNPSKPAEKDDKNIPKEDDNNKPINREDYVVVGFKVSPDKSGTLTLGKEANKAVISALVKKGTEWAKVTLSTPNDGNDYTFWHWDNAPADKVADGQVRVASFIKSGEAIDPTDQNPLPNNFHKVTVAKGTGVDGKEAEDKALFGKTYAVKKGEKLAEEKFPALVAEKDYKNPAWDMEKPWTGAVADKDVTYTASATSSVFDKENITKIEIIQAPTKMTYTEGEKPNHDGLKIQLTDQNANTVDIAKDQLADYGVTVTPAETVKLTVNDHQGRPFIARAKDKDGTPLTAKTKADITVKVKAPAQNKSSHRSKTIQKPEAKPAPKPETKPETKPEVKPESKLSNHDLNKAGHYSYLTGYPDGTFAPNKGMTRAEVASLFTRLLKDRPLKGQSYKAGLTDVYAGDWYADAVGYAVQKGIVSGYPDGSFKPNQAISRGEFAAIAARFADMTGDQHPAFSDLDPNHWSYQAIRQVAANGWLSGYPDGSFKPNQPITRAEVATVSNRMLNRTPDLDRLKAHTADLPQYNDVGPGDWFYGAIMEAGFDRP
ncbi:MAG: S-layer homology domain-containing protein [Clostridiales bacterium]|nr:S-layer homology domain-containing protein [Clostridiales bacterium]